VIIRILTEGQFDVPDGEIEALNRLDERLEAAIEAGDDATFTTSLGELLAKVRDVGKELPVDEIVQSDLLLPYSDATLAEVRDLLSGDGLIPGRSATADADA